MKISKPNLILALVFLSLSTSAFADAEERNQRRMENIDNGALYGSIAGCAAGVGLATYIKLPPSPRVAMASACAGMSIAGGVVGGLGGAVIEPGAAAESPDAHDLEAPESSDSAE